MILLAIPFFNVEKDVSFEVLQKNVQPHIINEIMVPANETTIYQKYHLAKNSYDSYYSYMPISYMDVEEITIFKVTDKTKQEQVLASAKEHIQKQIKAFNGYGINQTELLKNAYIDKLGSYVIVVVHRDCKNITNEIKECF